MNLNILPQNGPSSPKNSPIDQSSYPPGLLTGPPQSPSKVTAEQQQLTLASQWPGCGRAAGMQQAGGRRRMRAPGAASREAATRSEKARADQGRLGAGAHSDGGATPLGGRRAAASAERCVTLLGSQSALRPWAHGGRRSCSEAEVRSGVAAARGGQRAAGVVRRRSTRPLGYLS